MAIVLDGDNTRTSGLLNSSSPVALTGTTVDFAIPAGVERITVSFYDVLHTSADYYGYRLGYASSIIVTSGYKCSAGYYGAAQAATTFTNGFMHYGDNYAPSANPKSGNSIFTLTNASAYTWAFTSQMSCYANYMFLAAGSVSLSGTLTTLRIYGNGGTAFIGGYATVFYE